MLGKCIIENGVLKKYFQHECELTVQIPEGVEIIGEEAFMDCSFIRKVIIPYGATKIANKAFYSCTSLREVVIPESVVSIGAGAFFGCKSLRGIKIPNGVELIEDLTFKDCTSLTEFIASDSLSYIHAWAFSGCKSLKRFQITTNLKFPSFELGSFDGCISLERFDIVEPSDGNGPAQHSFSSIDGVVYYSRYDEFRVVFVPPALEKITLPENSTAIHKDAFSKSKIRSLFIPKNVYEIDEDFHSCDHLERIDVDPDNLDYSSDDGILYNKHKAALIFCPRKRTADVTLNKNTLRICEGAFKGCSAIKKVDLNHTPIIERNAFAGCTELEEILSSDSLQHVGTEAFRDTKWLHLQRKNNPLVIAGSILIDGTEAGKETGGVVTVPKHITEIAPYAFSNNRFIKKVVFPKSIDGIGITINNMAFQYCTNLEEIDILHSKLERIETGAFYHCESLKKVDLPSSVKSINRTSFLAANSLEEINIEKNDHYVSIDGMLFTYDPSDDTRELYMCPNGLSDVIISDGTTFIDKDAFTGCKKIKKLTIPYSVLGFELDKVFKKLFDFADPDQVTVYCEKGSDTHKFCESANVIYELI